MLRNIAEVVGGMPDELSSFMLLSRNRATGERIVAAAVCLTGSSEAAHSRLGLLRSIPGLVADLVRPMSYLQLQGVFGEIPFGLRHYWKGRFVDALPDELVDFAVEHFGARTSPLGGILIEPLYGYAARVPDDATAFANRQAAFNLTGLSMWVSPAADDDETAWARAFADGVASHSTRGGGYLNYMSRDEPLERVAAAYGADKFARLQVLKHRYDPNNLFQHNHNIPPAG